MLHKTTRKVQTAELLLRTSMAVNQLTMKGAVAKWCNSESPPQTAETQGEKAQDAMYRHSSQLA